MNLLRTKMKRKVCILFYLFLCTIPTLLYSAVYWIVPDYSLNFWDIGWLGDVLAWLLGCFYFGSSFLYRSNLFISWIMDAMGKRPKEISATVRIAENAYVAKLKYEKRQCLWRCLTFFLCIVPPIAVIFIFSNIWPDYPGWLDVLLSCFNIAVLISHTQIE